MVAHFGLDVVRAYMSHVQDNAEESVRRVIGVLKDGAFELRDGQRRHDPREDHHRRRPPQRHHRLHRHQRASSRATSTRPPAVVYAAVLYVFRTLVDDEIPLNAGCLKPLKVIIPEGSMLNPASAGGHGRRQRRDLAMPHRRALRRAGRDGRLLRHDEQLHLRQRPLPVLRDDLGRHRRGPGLRRHRHRPGAHDQLAPHRSRGARVALPGAHRRAHDPPRQRRRRESGPAATAPRAACASWSR